MLKKALSLTLMSLMMSAPLYAQTMRLTTGDWRPFVFADENGVKAQLPGYSIEIVNTVLRNMGYHTEYTSLPFMRQRTETYRGEYDAIVATAEGSVPGLVFPKLAIGEINTCFFVAQKSRWHYNKPESLQWVKLGVVAGHSYGEIDSYITQYWNSRIYAYTGVEENRLSSLVELLSLGQVTAIAEDKDVMEYFLQQQGKKGMLKSAGCLEPTPLVIGFTAADMRAQEWADQFDVELESLRKSGVLKQILNRYGVYDWVVPKKI
ncbi:transporter substrate-binding domain-containing protein [Vibrio sp. SCSIO 43136]|uniref:substrate-binding periplasmic protein n=1 Tax=Vibrio sp. SCSIO 43136 TaxID=2819101 RepID=UPI0020762891|nr:transporter substrate-binding domain-containing protein [Vibrio sp. SCSIO 43136]USD67873.1 transporter substrate-binding domain-containing protein [Vibrio sp. SCSIO 43136]